MTSSLLRTVADDANVLLSAVTGKAALRVFLESSLTVATTAFNVAEVREYLPSLAAQYGLVPEILDAQLSILPLTVYSERAYRGRLADAARLIGGRDPDDVHLLALSLTLDAPIWSNDKDFKHLSVEVFTTAELLKRLASNR